MITGQFTLKNERIMEANPHPLTKLVPCNGCKICCYRDAIRLLPGDNPDEYKTAPHPYSKGMLMLDHKSNGFCIYANENGCSIHHRRPLQCRTMDCRIMAKRMTYTKARKIPGMLRIWNKGKELTKETK